jgi:hypothetical protein
MVIEPLRPPLREPLQDRRNQQHHTRDDQFLTPALPQTVESCDSGELGQQVD